MATYKVMGLYVGIKLKYRSRPVIIIMLVCHYPIANLLSTEMNVFFLPHRMLHVNRMCLVNARLSALPGE